MRTATLLPILLAFGPAELTAQWHSNLTAGDRIEITWPRSQTAFTGAFIQATTDSVWIRRDHLNDTLSVSVGALERLRVSRGRTRSIRRSAAKGFLIGAGIGASFGLVTAVADPDAAEFFDGPIGSTAFFGVLFGIPGFVLGGLFGISVERWEAIPLPLGT